MKQTILSIIALFCCAIAAQAQDVIVKRDGSTILTKVLEVNQSDIKYKKFSNQNGPTYTINKSEVMSINYEGGDKDTFEEAAQPAKQETEGKQQIIEAKPAVDNAEIISRYNRTYEHGEAIKDKDKPAKEGLCILGVKEKSVLSSEDIVIEFRQEPYISHYRAATACYNLMNRYKVVLFNKTDSILYVDLGNTFRVMANGTSYTYYDNSQTTVTKGSGSGISANIGAIAGAVGIGGTVGALANGFNVGGGNSSSTSKTFSKQRIISIPPHGRVPIEEHKVVMVSANKSETISEGEVFLCGYLKNAMPSIMRGAKYFYTEYNSPYYADYTISYSKTPDFANMYLVKSTVYLRELIGAWTDGDWYEQWRKAATPQQMRKYIPDYNDYTIVGAFGYVK